MAAALSGGSIESVTGVLRAIPPRVLQSARIVPAVKAALGGAWKDALRQALSTAVARAGTSVPLLTPEDAFELSVSLADLGAALNSHPIAAHSDTDRRDAALRAMRRIAAAPARTALAQGDVAEAALALSAAARELPSASLKHIPGKWLAELHTVSGSEAAMDMPDQSALRPEARTVTVDDLRRAAGAAAIAQTHGTLWHGAVPHKSLAQFAHWLRGHTSQSLPGVEVAGLSSAPDAASPDYHGGLRAAEADALLPYADGRRATTALHTGVIDTEHLPGASFLQWVDPSGLRLHVTLLPSGTAVMDVTDVEAAQSLHIVYTRAAQDKRTRDRLMYEMFAFLDCRFPPTVEIMPATSVALSAAIGTTASGDVDPSVLGALARLIGTLVRSACDPAVVEGRDPVATARVDALRRRRAANAVQVPDDIHDAVAGRRLEVPAWAENPFMPQAILTQPVIAPDGNVMQLEDAIVQYESLGTVGNTRDAVALGALPINRALIDAIQDWVDAAAEERAERLAEAAQRGAAAAAAGGGSDPGSACVLPREP